MQFTIGNKKFESNKINLIAIDGTNSLMSMAGGYDRYHITIRGNNKARYDLPISCQFDGAKSMMSTFSEQLKNLGLNNFINIHNNFIVNLDKVADYHWQYNLMGHQYIWVEFEDGSQYALYRGTNEERAEALFNSLQKVQRIYLRDKNAGKNKLNTINT